MPAEHHASTPRTPKRPTRCHRYGATRKASDILGCIACEDGTFCPLGSQAPQNCSLGSYTNSSTPHDQCSQCNPGTYQLGVGATACEACPAGDWCSGGAANPCGRNTYANQSVGVRTTQADCLPCMANAQTSGDGAHSIAACGCVDGFYRSMPATEKCDQCPLGAECARGTLTATLRLKEGYWRTSNTSADVRACPISGTCIGNVDDPATGYCGGGLDPRVPYCS